MSKETAAALLDMGAQMRADLQPQIVAQADRLRVADQAHAAAKDALAIAQGNADAAAAGAAGEKSAMGALEGRASALDKAVDQEGDAIRVYAMAQLCRDVKRPEYDEAAAKYEAEAMAFEALGKAVISP